MKSRLMTPSKVSAWLECPHYLTLQTRVDEGLLAQPRSLFGSFAELVMAKGLEHEEACLENYRQQGANILTVESRAGRTFQQWVADVGNPFTGEYDVVYQMPFVFDGMRGISDFVIKVNDPISGTTRYEPVDAKLARTEARPGHVLQLCFYADAIQELTVVDPQSIHLWLGSGDFESLQAKEFRPYWRRLRGRLTAALDAGPQAKTAPQPCSHCEYCEFSSLCDQQLRQEDSLFYIAGIRRPEVDSLTEVGITTLAQLAALDCPTRDAVGGLRSERLKRLAQQAKLQRSALDQDDMPFSLAESEDDETKWGLGLQKLPRPDDGDVFIDFEGHPLWRPETGLMFLFGLLEFVDGRWSYKAWWAHDKQSEIDSASAFVAYIADRRERFPGMHAYHYNHTERSTLQSITEGHAAAEAQLRVLIDTGAFVDLYEIGLNGIQIGAESYSLKCMEKLTAFQRGHEIDKGAGAVLKYEHYMAHENPADLEAIAAYNEDDVRATHALRDWFVANRPPDTVWRDAYLEPEDDDLELDETIVELHARGGDEHFLADLLGYWRRERRAYFGPKLAKLAGDPEDQLADPEIIGELHCEGEFDRFHKKNGKPITPGMRFTFPAQQLEKFPRAGGEVLFATDERQLYSTHIAHLNRSTNQLDLVWNEDLRNLAPAPLAVAHHDWIEAKPKPQALQQFAEEVLRSGWPDTATTSLLRSELPRFSEINVGGGFTPDVSELSEQAARLDRSFLAVQGPPGTGKTHTAAHVIHALIMSGKRVGITAVSHPAINNLLKQVAKVFEKHGDTDSLRGIRQTSGSDGLPSDLRSALKLGNNSACAQSEYNLVAGTTWVFASQEMRAAQPVDILVIDEAGQMSLADTLAASLSARNLLLVGDPLQLPQVTQGSHPGGSGHSVLEHILGADTTIPPERGVFLDTSRRMRPNVCKFISEQIYGGRLESHPDCARQSTAFGTGLRWLPASHEGNTTSSDQEASLVVEQIRQLIGTDWTDHKGNTRPLRARDFVVVTPYNDQRRLLRERLEEYAETAGIEIGTVDKFQGQEAAVVFFSMATSSGENVVHGKDFLFSRNRLNVAISRARCLAYLICTEELLNTRARSIDEMRLISTLNAFVEWAE